MNYFHVRRGARGAIPVFTAVNTGAAALFNNSGAMVLRLWQICSSQSGAGQFDLSYKNGRLTTQGVGTIAALYAGDGTPPGLLDKDDLVTAPTPDFYCNNILEPTFGQGSPYPFAMIPPGWSLVAAQEQAAQKVAISFLWDWVYPYEVISPMIGDPAIDRRARP